VGGFFLLRVAALAIAVIAAAAPARPETRSQAQTPTASIRGRVVAGDTGLPVRGATVTLAPMNGASSIGITDDDGGFELREVAAGRYILRVMKTGFVSTLFDLKTASITYFEIREGQRIDRGELRLPKAGVIAGRVFDSLGDPAAEISVTGWRVEYLGPGERNLTSTRSVETNDLGEYRLFGLAPGKYYVSAGTRGSTVSPGEGGKPVTTSMGSVGLAPTFHPGTANGLEAQAVAVKVNEETPGTNIRLQTMSFTRVTGLVRDSSGAPVRDGVVMVNPSRADGASYFSMNMSETDSNGRFAISAVPPGEYRIDVQPKSRLEAVGSGSIGDAWKVPGESASVPLTVTGDPLPDLQIVTGPGARLAGRVLLDDVPVSQELASRLQIVASPVLHARGISQLIQATGGPVARDGSFLLSGAGGPRLIRVVGTPAGTMTLQRVVALGADVTDSGIDVGPEGITGIEVRLTSKLSVVSGVVTDAAATPVPGATVIVYSNDGQHWMNLQNRRVTFARVISADGTFSVNGLPEGRYLAIAVAEFDRGQWADPDNLEKLRALATPFSLLDGEKRSLTLVRR